MAKKAKNIGVSTTQGKNVGGQALVANKANSITKVVNNVKVVDLEKFQKELTGNNSVFSYSPLVSALSKYCSRYKGSTPSAVENIHNFEAQGLYGATILKKVYGDNLRYSMKYDSFYLWDKTVGCYRRFENQESLIHAITSTMTIVEHSAFFYIATTVRDLLIQKQNAGFGKSALIDIEKAALSTFTKSKEFVSDKMAKEILTHYKGMWLSDDFEDYYGNPYINMQNGTLNLITMELLPHSAEFKQTKVTACNYEPEAVCPEFKAMLERVLPSEDTRREFQKSCGLVLAPQSHPLKKAINMLIGPKDAGKTTVMNTIIGTLGAYGTTVDSSLLMQSKLDKTRGPEMEQFQDALMISSSESNESDRLDDAKIKALTGNTEISYRFNYSNKIIKFKAICGIFLDSNHKPYIPPHDTAVWDRLRYYPFVCPVKKKDPDLGVKLAAEKAGIFNWLLEGMKLALNEGLTETPEMLEYKEAFIKEVDVVAQFLEDCTMPTTFETDKIPFSSLYDSYVNWCKDTNHLPSIASKFHEEVKTRLSFKKSSIMLYQNIKYSELGLLYSHMRELTPIQFAKCKAELFDRPALSYANLRTAYFHKTWPWFIANIAPNNFQTDEYIKRDFLSYCEWCSDNGFVGLKYADFSVKLHALYKGWANNKIARAPLDAKTFAAIHDDWAS